jgi:hypothetical protein
MVKIMEIINNTRGGIDHIPQKFWIQRLIPLEKIKIDDINIILERSQKYVIDKIEVKMLGKNQNGNT